MSPLVLLHGFLGLPTHFDTLRRLLPKSSGCVAPLLPGHGAEGARTAHGGWDETIDALARLVPPGAWLCGYSLGARLALGIASQRTDLAGLTLVSGHPGLTDADERRARALLDEARARAVEEQGIDAFAEAWGKETIVQLRTASADDRTSRADARRRHVASAIAWSLRALGLAQMPSLAHVLASRPYPVHLVTGEHDSKFTTLAATLATVSVTHHLAPHAGHDVVLDAPAFLADLLCVSRAQKGTPS